MMTNFFNFQLNLCKAFSFTFHSSSFGGRGIARTCNIISNIFFVKVLIVIIYFQSIYYDK